MKKKLVFLIIILFLLVSTVNAKKCNVETGDGTKFGDVITCGTESFYVLKHTDTETYLLSKYNLLVGDKIDFIDADSHAPSWADYSYEYDFFEDTAEYCNNYAQSKGYHAYYTYPLIDYDKFDLKGCRTYEKIEYEHVKQDEKAKGTILVNGKSQLPLYGITYMVPEWGYEAIHDNIIHRNLYDDNGDLILEGSSFKDYLDGYKEELTNQGLKIKSVSFPNLVKILEFMESVSGKQVEFNLISSPALNIGGAAYKPEDYVAKMDIKTFIPESYKWLYDRTYWLGSGFTHIEHPEISPSEYNDYYISNEGFLCALGRGECGYFDYPIGNGIRPVVEVLNDDIMYKIETKTDGNGEIKVEKIQAHGGEVIKFTVIPNEGYVLGVVKVTDATGKVVYFTDYTFTMPNANVLIEATFVKAKTNPKTADIAIFIILIVFISSVTFILVNERKLRRIR